MQSIVYRTLWKEQKNRILNYFCQKLELEQRGYLLVDNYELGKVSNTMGQYVDGILSTEKERNDFRTIFIELLVFILCCVRVICGDIEVCYCSISKGIIIIGKVYHIMHWINRIFSKNMDNYFCNFRRYNTN